LNFEVDGAEVRHLDTYPDLLTPEAVEFLVTLTRVFRDQLKGLLKARKNRNLLDHTLSEIPDDNWRVASCPRDIRNRRVEITGPPERKMVINALNSGANVFMADFEDSLSPTWQNLLEGQHNLKDAVRRTITYQHPTKGLYTLCDDPAVLFVRPRGLHLTEAHFLVDGERIPAALFDFGLFMFHNAQFLVQTERAPYFYLPKLEHHLEARWWNEVFNWTQITLSLPMGVIRATVLIETLPAALQMERILYELREHSAGLNCGRWDYIFSYIKAFWSNAQRVLPDRGQVTMTTHFLQSYSRQLIQVCHRHGAHAMGGMAAQIPIRDDADAHAEAMAMVRADKVREAAAGHDGTWVAHPGLVELAQNAFDETVWDSTVDNQIDLLTYYDISMEDLLVPPKGTITMEGLQQNVDVGIRYLAAWLEGNGCVPLYNLMEDTATAEISRSQVWQWIRHAASTEDGVLIDEQLLDVTIKKVMGDDEMLKTAADLFRELCLSDKLPEFLTLTAYEKIINV
jgi:malate synthase